MPKAAARIWDEVVSVKAERVQDITEKDAIAEGIELGLFDDGTETNVFRLYRNYLVSGKFERSPIDSYQSLWTSINGPGSWDANPFVWVVTTKTLSTTGRP
jgi:hypothetical protein